VHGAFSLLDPIPTGARPTRDDIFGSIDVDYKLFLNILGLAIFATLFWLARGGDHHHHAHVHHEAESLEPSR
jgi:hypothetical protein